MSTNVRIPKEVGTAVEALATLGALVSAKEWHRAAIVAALTLDGRRRRTSANAEMLTYGELATKGVVGLRDQETIAYYRDCWLRHREVPALGSVVDLDGLPPWPGIPSEELAQHTSMTPERKERLRTAGQEAGMPTGAKVVDIAANPKAMRTAIENDEETAAAAEEALMNRSLGKAGLPGLNHQGDVPDPTPQWRRLTLNIAGEIRTVLTVIGDLRESGQTELADQALADLREVLNDGIVRCETIPDTAEGIAR